MKKSLIFLVVVLTTYLSSAQCAMCKAVVENGDSDMAEGINSGIIYLMIFPYLFLALGIFFAIKQYKKKKNVT